MDKLEGYCGIMQPYFFPYWGHFSLIAYTSRWIVFDDCNYRPKSWMNRNRILHPNKGWQYITVPISNSSRNIKISEVKLINPEVAKQSIIRKLEHYKKRVENFLVVSDLVEEAFNRVDSDLSLTSLCKASICVICEYLGIELHPECSSNLNICYPPNVKAGEWAPLIAQSICATGYLNPISGAQIFEISEFKSRNIELKFLEANTLFYSQKPYERCNNLSILDTLMWMKPEDVKIAIKENVTIVDGAKYIEQIDCTVGN